MNKRLLSFLICFYLPSSALAHTKDFSVGEDEDGQIDPKAYRVLKEVELVEGGKAFLLAREDGHLLGQPFQIELRVKCPLSQADENPIDPLSLPVKDSFSVCDIQPESVKINSSQKVMAMKTKMANVKDYYEQIERGVPYPEVQCLTQTKIKKFSLHNLCPSRANP